MVAVDSGAEVILPHAGVRPDDVRDLVHGAIFTRGGKSLGSTAIFIGGSDVALGEEVLRAAQESFIGPLRVSLMLDSAGANTTAAAAATIVFDELRARGGETRGWRAVVLGSTGPVGRRVVRLLAGVGAEVTAASRSAERAARVAAEVRAAVGGDVQAVETSSTESLASALEGAEVVVAAGGPGVRLLPLDARRRCSSLRLVIDLNAVPPGGIEGVEARDAGATRTASPRTGRSAWARGR